MLKVWFFLNFAEKYLKTSTLPDIELYMPKMYPIFVALYIIVCYGVSRNKVFFDVVFVSNK